ncbi:sugar phosphate isomerase/epimerase [Spirosoma sp. KCTC 42546]|uniref:sugar phosphate isomerase/epimerase family protein n=1 Tax=Spirosoma sp. KCTC 42546 TaxID=2520506 RepID=UPI0011594E17|nr:sugar phosphate isomerase/epimerase family protein [Spirosoma sp. KCTC 42546]QDK79037.1 sugar phosphate isomerase/epimerase [Spirosoma sp. KCTC 42546]
MERRTFLSSASGLIITVWVSSAFRPMKPDKMDRIAMGTVLFRYRFKQTKPKEIATIANELTLLDVPAYYKKRFGIRQLEFWSNHFESLEKSYLDQLKASMKASSSRLINVQVDSAYDLASNDETERQRSLAHVKEWMDAVAYLGSPCVRINPGRVNGSVEKSIESMKEVNQYAQRKKLILLTENHFGLEMNPDVHVRIVQEAGPKNIYTLPDFGNYSQAARFDALAKIMPYAYLISAKADSFNENMEHTSYDFDQCVQLAERMGFKGIYSLEQYSGKYLNLDYEKVADWLIEHVKRNI